MSGHSKWSTIKRKKGAADSKRAKIFGKLIKEITVAAREGGSDIDSNPRLRMAVANAKGANMPKDNIERAIDKGKSTDESTMSELVYEGYGAGGVAILVECLTENTNRTVSNVRSYFTKSGGNLATQGSVAYMFDKKGVFTIPKETRDDDEFTLHLIDAGAEDIAVESDYFIAYTSFEDFGSMQKKLEDLNCEIESAAVQYIPQNTSTLDLDKAKSVLRLIDILEDDEDVQAVYHNLEMTDELAKEIG